MRKILVLLFLIGIALPIFAQTIRQKNKYGVPRFFVDGQTIKQKDKYGNALYFRDGLTIWQKDKYGNAFS